jgi:putative membrane protein
MWNWNGAGWWWWFLMSGGMLLFWGFAVWIVIQIIRGRSDAGTSSDADPEAILAARVARGEIDEADYQTRLDVLRSRGRRAT